MQPQTPAPPGEKERERREEGKNGKRHVIHNSVFLLDLLAYFPFSHSKV